MSEDSIEPTEPTEAVDAAPEPEDELVRAVRACQLTRCTQVVPEALAIRVEAARKAQADGVRWYRTAAAHDAKVLELEGLYLRTTSEPEEPAKKGSARRPAKKAGSKSSGSRGRRSTKKEGK